MQCLCDEDSGDTSSATPSTKPQPRGKNRTRRAPASPCRVVDRTSEDLQLRLFKFHQSRVLNSPSHSVFRRNLELHSDLEEDSPNVSDSANEAYHKEVPACQSDAYSQDLHPGTMSLNSDDESRSDHSTWLNKIRNKRKHLEQYLSVVYSPRDAINSSLRDNYLGPQTSAPTWFRYVLENGVSFILLPASSADAIRASGEAAAELSSFPRCRVVKIAASTPSLIRRYQLLNYSYLALSEPGIFVTEVVSNFSSKFVTCANGDRTRYNPGPMETPSRRVIELTPAAHTSNPCTVSYDFLPPDPPGDLFPEDIQSHDSTDCVFNQANQSCDFHSDPLPCDERSNDFSDNIHHGSLAKGDKQSRPFITRSAAVTECKGLRVVVSGSFKTAHGSCLPFQLVMFACHTEGKSSTAVKGIYQRKSLKSDKRFRWRFYHNL